MAFVSAPVGVRVLSQRAGALCGSSWARVSAARGRVAVRACAQTAQTASGADTAAAEGGEETRLKEFLNSLGGLGRVRLVTNNGLAVLESIAPLDKLFYATVRGAEYGNVIDHSLNVDLHIRLDAVAAARFEVGKSRTNPPVPTYAIRLLGDDMSTVKLSMFVQWDKSPDDVAPERIAHWKALKEQFAAAGEDVAQFK